MHCVVCDKDMYAKNQWVYHCTGCGFWQSTLTAGGGRGIDGIESLRRNNFVRLCDQLEKKEAISGLECLEVGCAEGWFLDEGRKRNLTSIGIEPSEVSKLAVKSGHDVRAGFFPDVLGDLDKFDLIIFNDVFEHLPDPINALCECEKRLRANGRLVLNLPSSSGFFYRVSLFLMKLGKATPFERLWQKGYPSPHLSYFNSQNLTHFVTKNSDLVLIDTFQLPSIEFSGLKNRIFSSHKGLMGYLLYGGISVCIPVINLLPSDIIVQVFQKPK